MLIFTDPKLLVFLLIFAFKRENDSITLSKIMNVNLLEVILLEKNKMQKIAIDSSLLIEKSLFFKIKNRTIQFIFELEKNNSEYQFCINGKNKIIPIFSILTLFEQNFTNFSSKKLDKMLKFIKKCLEQDKNNAIFQQYLKMVQKKLKFIGNCLNLNYESDIYDKKDKKNSFFLEKNFQRQSKNVQFKNEENLKENLIKMLTKKNKNIRSHKNFQEKLFPSKVVLQEKKKIDLKENLMKMLPIASDYIKNHKENKNFNFSKSSNFVKEIGEVKCEELNEKKIGSAIGFFDYHEERNMNEILLDLSLKNKNYEKAIYFFEEKVLDL